MGRHALWIIAAAVLAAGLPAAAPAADGRQDDRQDDWQAALTRQLLEEQDCVVDFYLQIEESLRDGERVIRARAHCRDQRLFEATRVGDSGLFTIGRCATEGARSC